MVCFTDASRWSMTIDTGPVVARAQRAVDCVSSAIEFVRVVTCLYVTFYSVFQPKGCGPIGRVVPIEVGSEAKSYFRNNRCHDVGRDI